MIGLNDFGRQWEHVGTSALTALERVGRSGWYILGREVAGFESRLSTFWGLRHAVGCANGLDALEIGLRTLGLCPGDKVLTTPLSAFATTLAIVRADGVPVFVDVDESGLIDLSLCERACAADRTIRFFVPVHLYGHALDLGRLKALRDRFGLNIVEDCAQAIGARSEGLPVGSVGLLAATSFYPTKNLGCFGDGGAVLTNDASLAERAKTMRDYGQSAKYVHSELGLNSRLDELQAALMSDALLPRLQQFSERRRAIADRYTKEIRNSNLRAPPVPGSSESAWHLYPLIVSGNRAAFQAHLEAHGVGSGCHYPRLIPDQPALAGRPSMTLGTLESAARFAEHEVSIPIHPFLTDAEIDQVIRACNTWRP